MAVGNRSLIELPDLSLECILLNLPLFSLLHWVNGLTLSLYFFLPLDGYTVTHSCNGFVLMEYENMVDGIHKCIVSNPVKGEYTKLPETEPLYRHAKCAFFYNPHENQLKILRLFISLFRYTQDSDESSDSQELLPESPYNDFTIAYSEENRMGELFVAGSDSWESLDTIPFCPDTIYSPCHLDKVTHWLCDDDKDENFIVFFNFESHTFGNLTGPAHMVKPYVNECYDLTLVHESLSVIDFDANMREFQIWKMNEYGNGDSWTLSYVIDTTVWNVQRESCMSDENFVCNGDIVVTCSDGRVFFFDLVNRTGRLVNHPPIQLSSEVVIHIPSLISLKTAVGDDNLKVLKVPSSLSFQTFIVLSATFRAQRSHQKLKQISSGIRVQWRKSVGLSWRLKSSCQTLNHLLPWAIKFPNKPNSTIVNTTFKYKLNATNENRTLGKRISGQ
ncbi:F-box domain, Galactose oxidase/kelch, beta-propeller [Artemisia annua]|uniref:F-box domain, Galactose oxidase/kelch, beta-propeller n=1 Tax=Artemisia annua TaxID=35608 RepID=A0A2U1KPD8_ARTAN|nr:F-box domain, Galactose oxidase/kelch, beta-propeller [Artemisia annua]